ncbi:MAG: DUF255 domain-containing protein [Phycisphaerae bacterium]|nr:DUF255 domain-containing protein [Phycisphaerae bacterium]
MTEQNDNKGKNTTIPTKGPGGKWFIIAAIVIIGIIVFKDSRVDINWQNDYDKALTMAKAENKPLYIAFVSEQEEFANDCKRIDETYRDLAITKLIANKFIAVKLDAQKHPELIKQFGLEKYPIAVVYVPDKSFATVEGFVVASEIGGRISNALKKARKEPENQ